MPRQSPLRPDDKVECSADCISQTSGNLYFQKITFRPNALLTGECIAHLVGVANPLHHIVLVSVSDFVSSFAVHRNGKRFGFLCVPCFRIGLVDGNSYTPRKDGKCVPLSYSPFSLILDSLRVEFQHHQYVYKYYK